MNSKASWRLPGCATGSGSSLAAIWFSRFSARGRPRSRPGRRKSGAARRTRARGAHSRAELGRFRLVKRLPAAAGLGGGSADAAAALRLLANEARLSVDDPAVLRCGQGDGSGRSRLSCPHARMMTGVGDQLGPLIPLPKMFVVLVNPQVQAPTPKVFAALGLAPGSASNRPPSRSMRCDADAAAILDFLASSRNDLEAAAVRIAPAIAVVRERLAQIPEAIATGMSGSGATCFALFGDRRSATIARRVLAAERPDWWVVATAIH